MFSYVHFSNKFISFVSLISGIMIAYTVFFSIYIYSFRLDHNGLGRGPLAIFNRPKGIDDLRWWNFLFQSIVLSSLLYSSLLGTLVSKDKLNQRMELETVNDVRNVTLVRFGSNGVVIQDRLMLNDEGNEKYFSFVYKDSIVSLKPIEPNR